MAIKNILVICPILPCASDVKSIKKSLNFLSDNFDLSYYDPLSKSSLPSNANDFYKTQKIDLSNIINNYDAIIGFSLGGILIQQLFNEIYKLKLPVVLISTPTFINKKLFINLNNIIKLINENKLQAAIQLLYELVYFPNKNRIINYNLNKNQKEISDRLQKGLSYVLVIDHSQIIQQSPMEYLHLLGENSALINRHNVLPSSNGIIHSIPKSGMRVLEDNSKVSGDLIESYLKTLLF